MNRAVFLDRDGTVTRSTALITNPKDAVLENNAADAIKKLNGLGFKIIIVTNQPQIARGMCTEDDVKNINKKISFDLNELGAHVNDILFCPHHPETHHDVPEHAKKYRIVCECRKPSIGMITEASKKHDIDISRSFMIGDRTVDIMAGRNAGMTTILLQTGEAGKDGKFDVVPDYAAADLLEGAKIIERTIKTKGIILAGGKGERLMPLTKDIPKPMIDINNRPALEYHIELLRKHGIIDVIICGSYLIEKIKFHFGNGKKFGVNITYPDENEPLGTGGAIRNAFPSLNGSDNLVVLNGDVMTNIDISKVLDFHEKKGGIATIVIRESDHPIDSDVVEIDENFRVVKYVGRGQEKEKMSNTGIMVLQHDIINNIPQGISNIEKDVVFKLLENHEIYAFVSDSYIKDMGTFERLETVRRDFPKQWRGGVKT